MLKNILFWPAKGGQALPLALSCGRPWPQSFAHCVLRDTHDILMCQGLWLKLYNSDKIWQANENVCIDI